MNLKVGAAYIRVSTDDQLEYSPDSQLKLIRDYAKRESYVIPEEFVFVDEGISGKRADKRPAFRLMIAQAKENTADFNTNFVWKYSRFARNQEEAIMYKNLLKKKGIEVRSISEPSSDSPFSSLIERIIEWMDEYYLINLAGEVRRGMKEKATRGEAMGTAPFGYTVKDKTFVINEDAETVRYLFSAFAAGKGARALAQELNEKGIKTRRGNAPDNRWVHYILTNPVYIGKIRWSTEGHANYDRAIYNGENVLTVDGKHPPIIDEETWNAVQARIAERDTEVKYKRKDSVPYMLKGLIRCGNCGATLTRVNAAAPSLQCHKYARGQCHVSHGITIRKANIAVIESLKSVIASGDFTFAPQTPPKSRVSHDWDKLIAAEEARLKRAKNALLDGAFSSEEYKAAKAEIEDSLLRLRNARDTETEETAKEPDPVQVRKKLLDVLRIVESPDVSEEDKNRALRSVLDKIVFHRPANTLKLFFIP